MDAFLNICMAGLNHIGRGFCSHAANVFVQSGVLTVVLLSVDFLLRRHIRATVRYWIWMLVIVKLLLPPTFSLPTGVGHWLGRYVAPPAPVARQVLGTAGPQEIFGQSMPPDMAGRTSAPPLQRSHAGVEAAVAEPVPVPGERLTWQGGAVLLWGIGVLGFAGLVIRRVCFVRGLVAQGRPAQGEPVDLLDECRRRMNIHRQVRMKLLPGAFSPAVCGLWRPAILLPETLLARLTPDNLRAVLIHELAHIRRADLWVNCLQTILQILYFYNPLVWLANAIVRRVREQAVDEMSLVALGAEARSYGATLIDVAEMAFWRASPALRLVGVAESKKSLEGRIRYMITRPIPKNTRVGICGLAAILLAAAVLLPMARAQDRTRQTADTSGPESGYSILLLDDKDPRYNDKDQYDDRLYLMDSKGQVEGAVTGLNIGQTIGGVHFLAVDEQRRMLWVVENVGRRLWHFDLASGKLLQQIPLPGVSAAAIDPHTGNVWCAISEGSIDKGSLQVISPAGKPVATYPIKGLDIAYSRPDRSFWVVSKDVTNVSLEGKVLGRIAGQIPWCAVSVSVDQKTGNAWVVVRAHPQVVDSRDELWIVDKNVKIQKRIDLEEFVPSCVAVDSERGVVWVGCGATTLRFTTDGEKLKSARQVRGFSVAPGSSADSVIATNLGGMALATVEEGGYVRFDGPPREVLELLSASQKWVAIVPWAGARLSSSPQLADLADYKTPEKELAEYPASARNLTSLGKALLLYANDHEDRLPETLDDVQSYLDRGEWKWLKDNVEYAGKGRTVADRPGVVVAYDKALLRQGAGTLVLYLDSHVTFESPGRLRRLGITPEDVAASVAEPRTKPGDPFRVYAVNRSVAEFPSAEDLSTPEAAYATINRIARDDPSAWQKVSIASLAERLAQESRQRKATADPEWARVLLNARIRDVMIWRDTQAAVIAELPQGLSSKKIGASVDVRYFQRENGRWLNAGNNRFVTVEEAEADFMARFDRPEPKAAEEQKVDPVTALGHLRQVALAAIMYAEEHKGSFASDLVELKPYFGDDTRLVQIMQNVVYLGKGVKRDGVASPAARPLAYWKTATATDGMAVAFFDGHAEVVKGDRLTKLGIAIRVPAAAPRGGPQGAVRTYEVNRSVADFPPTEDMSTPEAAYATINRMDRDDPSAWQKVSVAALAGRPAQPTPAGKTTADAEWAKVLSNARIREVLVWNMTRAAVIAELPQEPSGKKIGDPIDVRHLQLENGRWLNLGNSRFQSVEDAKTQFMGRIERETAVPEALQDPLRHAGEIKAAALLLFEKLRTADYADLLSYYRDGKWDPEGWKKFPTLGLYMVHTDYPSFALWCCTHFKDNPIVDVQLGEVFIGDALIVDKTGWPTVPYRLTLKDGATLAGNLAFNYDTNQDGGHWHGMEGIDWHVWSRR